MNRRVLLKISGEAFLGSEKVGIEEKAACSIADRILELQKKGFEVGVVLGGGNIFRGLKQGSDLKLERNQADRIGMLATMMNGLALESLIQSRGGKVKVFSAISCGSFFEPYSWEKADEALREGYLLLFVAGTGNPYFTTDTAAALRASELKADIFLKATFRVDGIYDKDPLQHKDAKRFDHITYREVLDRKLGIMDLTAVTLCMTNNIPIRVFNFHAGSFEDALKGKTFGTLVSGE